MLSLLVAGRSSVSTFPFVVSAPEENTQTTDHNNEQNKNDDGCDHPRSHATGGTVTKIKMFQK